MITLATLVIGGFLLPPARYDHAPREEFKLVRIGGELFDAACRNYETAKREILGCDFGRVIFIRDNLSPAVYQLVLRHEYGHLNGWAASHPGGIELTKENENEFTRN